MKARLVQLERSGPAGRTRIEGMKVSVVISARGDLLLEMQRCNRKVNLRQVGHYPGRISECGGRWQTRSAWTSIRN